MATYQSEKNDECERYMQGMMAAHEIKKKNCNRSNYASPARVIKRMIDCQAASLEFTFYSKLHYYRGCVQKP